jgi:hypothetical protein
MSLFLRISNLFSRSRVDREIEGELKSYIEMRIEDSIAGVCLRKRLAGMLFYGLGILRS